ncbi:MAG: DNA polymerase I [Chloroflexota bacterium]
MSEDRRPLLLLFDGNALLHRAFHALPPLTVSRTGEMVNAVYGFANTLLKVLADYHPTHYAVAFDRPAPTFRHDMFKEYKSQRPAAPEELKTQIQRVHELVRAFNMPVFELDGFEADDVLGTLARQARGLDVHTIVVTGDNDMLQLVMPDVRALTPRGYFSDTILYDEDAVLQKYGVRPEQIPDYKALVGDPSDNIPGVPGVGPKTAARLIQQHGSLEHLYERLDQVSPDKVRTALEQHREQTFQSRELVTIVTDAPVTLRLEECRLTRYDRETVVRLFQELEFFKLLNRLPQSLADGPAQQAVSSPSAGTCETVTDPGQLDEALKELEGAHRVAVEVETRAGRQRDARPLAVILSPRPGRAFLIPLEHTADRPLPGPVDDILRRLRFVLESDRIPKLAYDSKQVMVALLAHGITLQHLAFDATIAAHLVGEKNLSLQALAFNRLGLDIGAPSPTGTRHGSGQRSVYTFNHAATSPGTRSDLVWGLRDSLEPELERQGLQRLFTEVELPLVRVLVGMEQAGLLLDLDLLRSLAHDLRKEMVRLEQEVYSAVGHAFNINSHRQLAGVLFDELHLPVSRKTKNGYTTEAGVLEAMRQLHPVVDLVLQYRQVSKLLSTYVEALPGLVNPGTGRVHTTFGQTGTTTGRLSSSDPNLQNIPIRGEVARKIRQAIVAPEGSYLMSADYSQIDLRALAHLSQDPDLVAAFVHNEDIHASTASRIFSVQMGKVTPDMRRVAKTVNFGVIYGMSDYGLEQATEFSREEATRFITLYFERFPRVKQFMEATKDHARKYGYVQTLFGRRRYIPEVVSPNRQVREAAERMAINAPVQGTSADIIKIAMVQLAEEITRRNLRSRMLLQIHDELVFEVPDQEVSEMEELVRDRMSSAAALCVPLVVDLKLGKNWAQVEQVQPVK